MTILPGSPLPTPIPARGGTSRRVSRVGDVGPEVARPSRRHASMLLGWLVTTPTPRHACPAVGGNEADWHAKIRLPRDRRSRQQMQRLLDPCSLPSAPAFTVFGRLDVLAAASSGAPHYFFSQIDDKLSRLPGRLAVSVHRKTTPRARRGFHIVLIKILIPTSRIGQGVSHRHPAPFG